MKVKIFFADLTHTKQGISSLSFPFGISLVASYAKKELKDKIEFEIFKYPEEFKKYLEKNKPHIVCFSSFSWTLDLSNSFAKKIKEKNPHVITVFGGPNFPLELEEQKNFLLNNTGIDIYIKGEGEKAFVELFLKLEKFNFDIDNFKKNKEKSPNCYYISDKELIFGEMLDRIENLDEIPSPYLTGILDKFFDGNLIPVIQTVRGCPFCCTYCQEGQDYFNKVRRFSSNRIKEELNYIAKKKNSPNLIITDSNFGMYEEDIETCKFIAQLKKSYNWPRHIEVGIGKNKLTVSKAVKILNGEVYLSASVQSTDEKVLENIKRKNISMEKIIEIAKSGEVYGANSVSEIILGLPGDTLNAHLKSILEMIDIGINVVRSHQLLMLPGSEISTKGSRKKFAMVTKFRLQPRCFGIYELYNEKFPVCEIDEICVENESLKFEDYLKCREFDLTVELFYNNGVFFELINFLKLNGISTSYFIKEIHNNIDEHEIKELYQGFLKENIDFLYDDKKELENYVKSPGIIEKIINENLRNNEQLKYRAIGFFKKMDKLHDIAFKTAKKILKENEKLDIKKEEYLEELFNFCLSRKKDLLIFNDKIIKRFKFDFVKMSQERFSKDPYYFYVPEGILIDFFYDDDQKELTKKYLEQFGSNENGLGLILSRSKTENFYRKIKYHEDI
ncbi:MAG: radical SAM protein [Candidatus Pacearchaeota archaeon]